MSTPIENNWEMCMACGCTENREWQEYCWECGFEIEY